MVFSFQYLQLFLCCLLVNGSFPFSFCLPYPTGHPVPGFILLTSPRDPEGLP